MSLLTHFRLPQIRKFFVPDPGKILFDVDLAGADAQIVAWEANDEPLRWPRVARERRVISKACRMNRNMA